MDNNKIISPETHQEKLVAALTVGFLLAKEASHPDSANLLLALRSSVQNSYRPVWTNGKAIRRYQGQDRTHNYLKDTGWRKEIGIFLDEKV